MKSTDFLNEAEVTPYQFKDLPVKKAVALLNEHCRQSLAMIHNPLWRGMRNHDKPIVMIDPSTGERKSQNTSNYYTELIDNSPYFEGWPKRSKSLVCSSSQDYSDSYAGADGLYALFPYDGVPIAVCPDEDIWATPVTMPGLGLSYGPSEDSLNEFNHFLRYSLNLPSSFKDMVKVVKSPRFSDDLENWRSQLLPAEQREVVTPETFIDYVQYHLSPRECGFRLMTIAQFAKFPPDTKECWVGGPVIAIRADVYKQFVDAVTKDPVAAGNPPKAVGYNKTTEPDDFEPAFDESPTPINSKVIPDDGDPW